MSKMRSTAIQTDLGLATMLSFLRSFGDCVLAQWWRSSSRVEELDTTVIVRGAAIARRDAAAPPLPPSPPSSAVSTPACMRSAAPTTTTHRTAENVNRVPSRPIPLPAFEDGLRFGKDFAAGAIAAVIAKTLFAPFERVKLLLQLQDAQTTLERRYRGVWDCFVRVPREQGVISFWRGNCVNIVRASAQESLGFAFNNFFKIWCLDGVDRRADYWRFFAGNIASGGASGCATYCLIYPLDFARTRLAIDVGRGTSREFTGFFDCLIKITRADGPKGLYRGFLPSLQFIFLYRATYFGLFDSTKVLVAEDARDISFTAAFMLGQVAAFAAAMISYPLDTVRRRLMMQSGKPTHMHLYSGTIDCTTKIYRLEGPRAFFKGAAVNVVRGVGAAFILAMYSEINKYI